MGQSQAYKVSIHHMLLFIADRTEDVQADRSVSIHHMLLFIFAPNFGEIKEIAFQYITCYSLSVSTFYRHGPFRIVSIHHMLLFIPRFIGILSIHMSNNTPKPKEFQYFYQALLEILYF